MSSHNTLSHDTLLKLKRWNTPTIYNGWEAYTKHDRTQGCFNLERTTDFMPEMGPMVGYAITVKIQPSNSQWPSKNPNCWAQYREYVASIPGPKIVIVQDMDKPTYVGSYWGEVNSNTHRALGCVGTITDGCIRDVDEMKNAGFKAISAGFCVGHAYSVPVEWNCEVEVFGCKIKPGDLVHADKHGFLVIPPEDQERLLDAAVFMDNNECNTVIPAARNITGKSTREILDGMNDAAKRFGEAVSEKFSSKGEW